jgi:hypothetical protein
MALGPGEKEYKLHVIGMRHAPGVGLYWSTFIFKK